MSGHEILSSDSRIYHFDKGEDGLYIPRTSEVCEPKEISEETPLYDLLNIRPIHEEVVRELALGKRVKLFVLGPVSAGKQMVCEQIIYHQLFDDDLVAPLDGRKIKMAYSSTPMANYYAKYISGMITSDIGKFTDPEISASNGVLEALMFDENERSQTDLEIVETVVWGFETAKFGVNPVYLAAKEARYDKTGSKVVKAIYIVPDIKVQDHGIEVREAIKHAKNPLQVHLAAENLHVRFPFISAEALDAYWGGQEARMRIDIAGDRDLMLRREEIEKHLGELFGRRITLPHYSRSMVLDKERPELRRYVHMLRGIEILVKKLYMRLEDVTIVANEYRPDIDFPYHIEDISERFARIKRFS